MENRGKWDAEKFNNLFRVTQQLNWQWGSSFMIFVSFCKHLMSTGTLCSQNNHSPNICCNNVQKVLANIILPVKNLLSQVLLCMTASQTLMCIWLPFETHILHFSRAPRWCQCCRSPDPTLSSRKARWWKRGSSHTSESSRSTSCLNILRIIPITPPTFPLRV